MAHFMHFRNYKRETQWKPNIVSRKLYTIKLNEEVRMPMKAIP